MASGWQSIIRGTPFYSLSGLSVVLTRQIGVLKMIVKIPSELNLTGFAAIGCMDCNSIYEEFFGGLQMDWESLSFKNEDASNGPMVMFKKPAATGDGQFTLYIPAGECSILTGEDYAYQFIVVTEEESGYIFSVPAPKSDIEIDPGSMTTLTVDLTDVPYDKMDGEE